MGDLTEEKRKGEKEGKGGTRKGWTITKPAGQIKRQCFLSTGNEHADSKCVANIASVQ